LLDHLGDVVKEAHVQHAVGLVQHQGVQAFERQVATFQVVHDAPGCAHHDVRAMLQRGALSAQGNAATERHDLDVFFGARNAADLGGDLVGQFACGAEHQGLHGKPTRIEFGEQGQGEGGGLAAAGLGLGNQVFAFEGQGQAGRLDRGHGGIAKLLQIGQHGRRQRQLGEVVGACRGGDGRGGGGFSHAAIIDAMVLTPPNRRLLCPLCARPQSSCICRWVTPITQPTEVLILQHPMEVHHAKNSAGLLHRSLPQSRVLVGEVFDAAALRTALQEPKYTLLLYPPSDYAGHVAPAPLDAAQLTDQAHVRLVVLDATWRKSRKMLHLSPWLQALPRLSLDASVVSGYTIRKAHKPGQCATLEATCAALAQLQGDAPRYAPLLQAFQGFVAQQATYADSQGRRSLPKQSPDM
jgi:DTW domain-containing protein YfiP